MKEREENLFEEFIKFVMEGTGFVLNESQKEMIKCNLESNKVNTIMERYNERRIV